MKTYFLLAVFFLLLISGNSFGQKNKKMSNSIVGIWSGKHILLEVSENAASIDYDCANGKINKKIILDKNNSFKLFGEYTAEHGGPILINEEANTIHVVYTGQVTRKKMSLSVKRKDNGKLIGKFTLYLGRESSLTKCR